VHAAHNATLGVLIGAYYERFRASARSGDTRAKIIAAAQPQALWPEGYEDPVVGWASVLGGFDSPHTRSSCVR
jgi:hypothetical protein